MHPNSSRQTGLTLVEMAIALTAIAVIVGGILLAMTLYENSKVTTTISQIKSYNSAIQLFKSNYAGLPGDISNPQARIPNCIADPCGRAGNTDNRIGTSVTSAITSANDERVVIWVQLARADLLNDYPAIGNVAFGELLPSARVSRSSGFRTGFAPASADLSGLIAAVPARADHYFVLSAVPSEQILPENGPMMTPLQAARIDRKLDDGDPNTGDVLAAGNTGAAGCVNDNTPQGAYNDSLAEPLCYLYWRVTY